MPVKKRRTGTTKGLTHRVARKPRPMRSIPITGPRRAGSRGRAAGASRRRLAEQLRVPVRHLSKRTLQLKAVKAEVSKIRKKQVLPRYSKLSPFSCRKKRGEARRDYFSMIKSGKGAKAQIKLPRKTERFTVRC